MLLIYSAGISSRLEYALQIFFVELMPTDYRVTSDRQEFQSHSGKKLNYSSSRINDECYIKASPLLFETTVEKQHVEVSVFKNVSCLFPATASGDLPFDPFAAAFYLVSRYEEYLPFEADRHGRFPDESSIGFKQNFYEIPVVNHYATFLKQVLLRRYPDLSFKPLPFRFQLTYDIDFAFAYRGKGMVRNAGGLANSIINSDAVAIRNRIKVLRGIEADPFDTFTYQFSLHLKFGLKPVYFFLVGDYGKFDKNISWTKKSFQSLIREIASKNLVGIHSSYASTLYTEKIRLEKERLEKISGIKIYRNRQHYLKLQFPQTYTTLLANGITEDYSMGYAAFAGFRAGIASPFYWYDLAEEKITALRIFPFTVMDASLHYYMKLNAEQAFEKTKQLIDAVKEVNGYFQFLAHNDLISEESGWKGWRKNFEVMVEYGNSK